MSDSEHDHQMLYCSMHDQYFFTNELRATHIQYSRDHPYCETCDRRFLNGNSLRNHFVLSRRHHYCSYCRKMFKTAAGFRMHVEYSPAHSDDDDDDDSDIDSDEYLEGWEDRLGPLKFPDEDKSDDDEEEDQSWLDVDCSAEADTTLVVPPSRTVSFTKIEENSSEPSLGEDDDCCKRSAARIVEYSCPICFATPNTVKATRCGHMFCSPCIRRALNDSGTCPVCRKAANTRQLRKISMVVPVC